MHPTAALTKPRLQVRDFDPLQKPHGLAPFATLLPNFRLVRGPLMTPNPLQLPHGDRQHVLPNRLQRLRAEVSREGVTVRRA